MQVLVITAGNCSACNGLKKSGGIIEIDTFVKSDGGKLHQIELPSMRDTFSSQGEGKANYKHLDGVVNQLFNSWFPMFIVMSNDAFTSIEDGSLSVIDEIAKAVTVSNGKYIQQRQKFDLIDRSKGVSAKGFMSWYNEIKPTANHYRKAVTPIARPIEKPSGNNTLFTHIPQVNSPKVTHSHSHRHPDTIDLGLDNEKETGYCSKKSDFYLTPYRGNK